MAQTDRQTNTQTSGHGDSMTDPAQRAKSVKIIHHINCSPMLIMDVMIYNFLALTLYAPSQKYFCNIGQLTTLF